MFTSVIPVAGLGTRSLPASKAIPKEMLPVFDRPMIQYVVEEAVQAGTENLILITSQGKSSIEDHFDISFELEASLLKADKKEMLNSIKALSRMTDIQTVRQKEQLGLGHAILMARNLVTEGPFGVLLADDLVDSKPNALEQLRAALASKKLEKDKDVGIVMLTEVTDLEVGKYGICEIEDQGSLKISRCIEKPKVTETKSRFGILGRYLLPTGIFGILEDQPRGALGEIQLTDALNELAKRGKLYGCLLKGKRFDAGDRLGFLKANLHYYLKSGMAEEVRNYLKEVLS